MRLIAHFCFATVIFADLVAFNRYRNSAGTHVMKRTESKPLFTASEQQLLAVMMQLIKIGSNPAALDQVKSLIQKIDQNKTTNSRLTLFLRSQ